MHSDAQKIIIYINKNVFQLLEEADFLPTQNRCINRLRRKAQTYYIVLLRNGSR